MQSRIKTLAILGLLLFLYNSTTAQVETIELCAGEALELNSEEIYDGTYFWEFSRDRENWITINHYDSPQFNYYPEESGFYRLRIQDEACVIDYVSSIKRIEVLAAEKRLILSSDLSGTEINEGEQINFELENAEDYEMISYHFNTGQTIVSPDGLLSKRLFIEETEVYVTARLEGSCFISNKISWEVNPVERERQEEMCGGYEISYEHWLKYHPNPEEASKEKYYEYLRKKEERFEKWMDEQISKSNEDEEIYTIPLIFHVIIQDPATDNESLYGRIIDQVNQLNLDFANTEGFSSFSDHPDAVDTGIRFCLAQFDQQGNSLLEPGLDRIMANQEGYNLDALTPIYINTIIKSNTIWEPDDYLNVWVIDEGIMRQQFLADLLPEVFNPLFVWGYSTFPKQSELSGLGLSFYSSDSNDGVVMDLGTIGSMANPSNHGAAQSYRKNKGRTLAHEIGHFLGLRHTWGDAIDEILGCLEDDYCSDTPNCESANNSSSSSFNCQQQKFSCESIDMIENFMDYSSDACRNIFTNDQKIRMRTVLQNSPRRASLVNNENAGCVTPEICHKPENMSFTITPGGVLVSWDGNDCSGYSISWYNPDDENQAIFSSEGSGSSYEIAQNTLTSNTNFMVELKGCCEYDESLFSEGISGTFFSENLGFHPCEAPYPQVQNLASTVDSQNSEVALTWTPIYGSEGVIIQYRLLGTETWEQLIELGSSLSSFTLSLAEMGPIYEARVRVGCSQTPQIIGPWSEIVNFDTGGNNYPENSVHCIPGGAEVVEVVNPATGRTWMDRNLGASQVATAYNDEAAYGDLYQWGRFSDGHQCRDSETTSSISSTPQPGHGDFITSSSGASWDWLNPQNDNLWQGVNGVNNPCPEEYRLPTEAELIAERESWSSNNREGAFDSPLKFSAAGYRILSSGSLFFVGSEGSYWSSTRGLDFNSSNADMFDFSRAIGLSVRCIKD